MSVDSRESKLEESLRRIINLLDTDGHPEMDEALDKAREVLSMPHTASLPQPTHTVGDRVVVGDKDEDALVIEVRLIQQVRLRYKAGHESVFYPSFVYERSR